MGFFSRFENKMEDTFDTLGDKMFDAPISPVQIAKKAEKQMRRNKMVGAGKQYAPTLYTILVNPDDDNRLMGYYPTLAGETETYLSAKAAEAGLEMDGEPLVRFISDADLKKGKFDVFAEAVAAPIVEQLRAEEMERYGIAGVQMLGRSNRNEPQSQFNQDDYNNQPSEPDVFKPKKSRSDAHNVFAEYNPNEGPEPAPAPQPMPAPEPQYAPQDIPAPEPEPVREDYKDPYAYEEDYRRKDYNKNNFERNDYAPEPSREAAQAAAFGVAAQAAAQRAESRHQEDVPRDMPYEAQPSSENPYSSAKTVLFSDAYDDSSQDKIPVNNVPPAHLRDANTGKVFALDSNRLVVGRENSCGVVLSDLNASRQHAQIIFENGVWIVNDLDSTNGTYVNGQEITTRQLNAGDEITIGVTRLIFNIG